MTKAFKCVDIGFDCGYETTAETDEEMMEKVGAHAKEVHDLDPIPPRDCGEGQSRDSHSLVTRIDSLGDGPSGI